MVGYEVMVYVYMLLLFNYFDFVGGCIYWKGILFFVIKYIRFNFLELKKLRIFFFIERYLFEYFRRVLDIMFYIL